MKSIKVLLDSYTKIQDFTRIVNEYPNDFDLVQGRYVVNAKSTMGILSLAIAHPISLNIRDAGSQIKDILTQLEPYIVTEEESR
jgi:phosphotransferase system HPr-like phosphotransfer protein